MSQRLREASQIHARLLKCGLEVESSRAFWSRSGDAAIIDAQHAFNEYWFGARSLSRTKVLLAEMKSRYASYPEPLEALRRWRDASADARLLVCHWHLQLTDPLYRSFTGERLADARASTRPEITREAVVDWVKRRVGRRWTSSTQVLYASKLLSAAHSAGLVASKRDPRRVAVPRVADDALEYLMYLLRSVRFKGTLLENPYVRSVGLERSHIEYRLQRLQGLTFKKQGELFDIAWRYSDQTAWVEAKTTPRRARAAGGRR
jgi:hypothetical protein